jgi:hypothetical protein
VIPSDHKTTHVGLGVNPNISPRFVRHSGEGRNPVSI